VLKKLHKYQYELLCELDRICTANKINYFLVDGTLLGAMYEGGFLPWDDDLDVGMYMEDYQHFLEIAPNQLNRKIVLQTYKTDVHYGNFFSQLRMKGTNVHQRLVPTEMQEQGIFIDIHPFVMTYEEKLKRWVHCARFKLYKHVFLRKSGFRANEKTLLDIVCRLVGMFYSRNQLIERMEYIAYGKKALKTDIAVKIAGRHMENDYIIISNLAGIERHLFMSGEFPVMPDSKRMLSSVYGDYDPIRFSFLENSRNRHGYTRIDFDE